MYLDKFVHSTHGKYLMSILLGIGVACLFRAVCKGPNCKILKAPKLEDIDQKVYKFDNKCYQLNRNAINCQSARKTVYFS